MRARLSPVFRCLAGLLIVLLPACGAPPGPGQAHHLSYTQHVTAQAGVRAMQLRSLSGQTQSLPLSLTVHIDRNFDAAERELIVEAVGEWNEALNGESHIEVAADAIDTFSDMSRIRKPNVWVIARIESSHPLAAARDMSRALAVKIGGRSGIIYVVHDRLGSRDLRGIVLHELGHVFGLAHDPRGKLMSPYYKANKQQCIDKGTIRAIAELHQMPIDDFDWCIGRGMEAIVAD